MDDIFQPLEPFRRSLAHRVHDPFRPASPIAPNDLLGLRAAIRLIGEQRPGRRHLGRVSGQGAGIQHGL